MQWLNPAGGIDGNNQEWYTYNADSNAWELDISTGPDTPLRGVSGSRWSDTSADLVKTYDPSNGWQTVGVRDYGMLSNTPTATNSTNSPVQSLTFTHDGYYGGSDVNFDSGYVCDEAKVTITFEDSNSGSPKISLGNEVGLVDSHEFSFSGGTETKFHTFSFPMPVVVTHASGGGYADDYGFEVELRNKVADHSHGIPQ